MPNAFAPQPPQEWQSVAGELKDLLKTKDAPEIRAKVGKN